MHNIFYSKFCKKLPRDYKKYDEIAKEEYGASIKISKNCLEWTEK
jgi:hypothetical protein